MWLNICLSYQKYKNAIQNLKKINVYQQAILDIMVQKTSSFDQGIPGSSYTNSIFEVILERAAQWPENMKWWTENAW